MKGVLDPGRGILAYYRRDLKAVVVRDWQNGKNTICSKENFITYLLLQLFNDSTLNPYLEFGSFNISDVYTYPQSLMGEIIYPRGRQAEKDISSFNTEGQEGTRVIRKFRPQGEVDMN